MRHFRQRIRLVHELAELGRTEELPHRCRGRLGVDQILRHHRIDLDGAHPLPDRTFHAQQADTVLVLHQLADGADTAVAEVIDVVDLALAVLQADQVLHHGHDILAPQDTHGVLALQIQTAVQLHATDRRQVIALRIEEQALEQGLCGFLGRRLTRTHDAVDVHQGRVAADVLVDHQGIADVRTNRDIVDVQRRHFLDPGFLQGFQGLLVQSITGFDQHFTGLLVDDVLGQEATLDLLGRDQHLGHAVFDQLATGTRGQLVTGLGHDLAGVGIDDVGQQTDTAIAVGIKRGTPAVLVTAIHHRAVEAGENLLCRIAKRIQQGGRGQLAAAVDADMHDVLGVEFQVQPATTVRDDPRGMQQLA